MLILKNIILLQNLSYFVFAQQVFFSTGRAKKYPDFSSGVRPVVFGRVTQSSACKLSNAFSRLEYLIFRN